MRKILGITFQLLSKLKLYWSTSYAAEFSLCWQPPQIKFNAPEKLTENESVSVASSVFFKTLFSTRFVGINECVETGSFLKGIWVNECRRAEGVKKLMCVTRLALWKKTKKKYFKLFKGNFWILPGWFVLLGQHFSNRTHNIFGFTATQYISP